LRLDERGLRIAAMAIWDDPPPPVPPSPEAELACSFCGRGRKAVACLVAGPGVSICDRCHAASGERRRAIAACSFCRASGALQGLEGAASPIAICDACLGLVRDILAER
jgi:hypothetical protein